MTIPIRLKPIATPENLFGPCGVCLPGKTVPLGVADTGHPPLLGWRQRPGVDGQPADWVIGQSDFHHAGQNAKAAVGPATLRVPTGICSGGEGLAIADSGNNRILLWGWQ